MILLFLTLGTSYDFTKKPKNDYLTYLKAMEKIESYQQLSLLVEAILKEYFSQKQIKEFTNNHEKLHKNFYTLKKLYPNYFKRLVFDTNGHYPVSEDLDSILQDFQICGITNKYNPVYKTIKFKGDDRFEENRKKRIPFIKSHEIEGIAAQLSI